MATRFFNALCVPVLVGGTRKASVCCQNQARSLYLKEMGVEDSSLLAIAHFSLLFLRIAHYLRN